MKLIIAGGRNFTDYTYMTKCLCDNADVMKAVAVGTLQVVSGTAKGADTLGEKFAVDMKADVIRFPPEYSVYGRGAPLVRNEQMAKEADAVALFPGGRGTDHMHRMALKEGITIYDYREKGDG